MNEKAKKVLSYVACAIGGACIGIALLGGLSYCSTSSAREKADTINTIDRVRHNYLITTETGAYQGYKFALSTNWTNMMNSPGGTVKAEVWSVDTSTYNLSLDSTITDSVGTANYGQDLLCSWITDYIRTIARTNYLRLLAVYSNATCYTDPGAYAYFTFIAPGGGVSQTMPFYKTGGWNARCINIFDTAISNSDYSGNYYIETNTITSVMMFQQAPNSNSLVNTYTFQDSISYFKSQGYADGYSQGETAGNSAGYSSGYEAGSSAGYESGYDQGFQEGYMNTYYAFTSLIVNRNAIWSMADIPWWSDEDTYIEPGHLNDYPFLDPAILQTNTYVNWAYLALFRDTATLIPYWIYAQRYTTSQNNGYVNFVIRISPADQTSTENAGNIGSYTGGVSLSETSIFQTETVTEWTAPNRCQLIAFGSEDPRDIYRDWFDNGYILPRGIAVDENAYEQGYKQGQLDAQRNTNMNNVFALFTPAFGAVASFFDMKIFGFLPLYWFLIAPLFIALISLIMRMVKH